MRMWGIFGCFCAAWGLSGQHLEVPQSVITVSIVAGPRSSPMHWERGRLVQIDYDKSTVFAFDKQGTMVLQSRIWLEDSLRVRIYNVAVSPAGTYAVTGTAVSTGGVAASFIALIDAEGQTTKVVQTSPAAAFSLRFADDGTLWAVVRLHDDKSNELLDYDMLRHYDASGVLIQTALPRKVFNTKKCPIQLPILTTSESKLGLYADVARTWVEVSFSGQILGRWNFPPPADGSQVYVDRVGLTRADDLIVSTSTTVGDKQSHGLYVFERNSQALHQIDTSLLSGAGKPSLLGLDDDVPVTTTKFGQLQWTPLGMKR